MVVTGWFGVACSYGLYVLVLVVLCCVCWLVWFRISVGDSILGVALNVWLLSLIVLISLFIVLMLLLVLLYCCGTITFVLCG